MIGTSRPLKAISENSHVKQKTKKKKVPQLAKYRKAAEVILAKGLFSNTGMNF